MASDSEVSILEIREVWNPPALMALLPDPLITVKISSRGQIELFLKIYFHYIGILGNITVQTILLDYS